MNKDLKDYIENNNYINEFNILINDRSRKWYGELGQEIINIYGEDRLPEELSYHFEMLKEEYKGELRSRDSALSGIGISYVTSYLGEGKLESLFGEPIKHNEFGEGFHEYDENDEPINSVDEGHRSFFPIINGIKTHIGYDHRGTRIEVPKGTTTQQA